MGAKKALGRFLTLAKHRGAVESAILDAMIPLYGSEEKANRIIEADPKNYMVRVVVDIQHETWMAYDAVPKPKGEDK